MTDMKLPTLPTKIERDDLLAALGALGIPAEQTLSLYLQANEATAVVHYVDEDGCRRLNSDGEGYQKATLTIPIV